MVNALKHLNSNDRHAVAIFFGLALLCFLYFASGILVTYVSSPENALEVARDGRGFSVRILSVHTWKDAEKLSTALWDQHRVPSNIEADPYNQGYSIKVAPLVKRTDAETLTQILTNSGYASVNIVSTCPQGAQNCKPDAQEKK